MAMHNNASTVEKAITSVFEQEKINRHLVLIISDDASVDGSKEIVSRLQLRHSNIILLDNILHSAYENRNRLQEYVIQNHSECVLMGRLDADDTLADSNILTRIENLWEKKHFDVLLMANNQLTKGQHTGYVNKPTNKLFDERFLLERLERMADGIWEAELPSCNVFIRPKVAIPYPAINSAEDHWNLVSYLFKKDELKICIEPDWIYCNYGIDGALSKDNRKTGAQQKSRKELYSHAVIQLEESARKAKALGLLLKYQHGIYNYLGAGFAGVVFHDGAKVYKVHQPLASNNFSEIDNILYLKEKLRSFDGRKHFFPLLDLINVDGFYILIYPYKKGEIVANLNTGEMISFLTEMWEMKLMCRSITKENNFIRVDGIVKLIDYEIEPYSDNLFLNLAARAFIQLSGTNLVHTNYNKLKRSTINQFHLAELDGFQKFLEKVFYSISKKHFLRYDVPSIKTKLKNFSNVDYDGIQNPSVSLLIKACTQDSSTLYNDIKFIVEQLPKQVVFKERLLLLDTYKHVGFIRQYSDQGNKYELLQFANKLIQDGIISNLIMPPETQKEVDAINFRWMGERNSHTHTEIGVPLTSQLFAFEQIQSDYILQMDVDVLIGKYSNSHDFLEKPIKKLKANNNAITWGFQIWHFNKLNFQPFYGEDGNVSPDPRFCLIDRKRLLENLPLENHIQENGWAFSWYRAMEKQQKKGTIFSLRGGDTSTFYAHIQNYRKENRWVWWTVMEAFRNNLLPEKQKDHYEVAGNIFDWTVPKRKEQLVIILLLSDANLETTHKTVLSIFGQDNSEFGLVIYNTTGERSITAFVSQLSENISNRITIIHSENQVATNEALYNAIHYYLPETGSFVCFMKQGDLLLGNTVFSECLNRLKLYNADLLIGKEFSSFTLSQNGLSVSDFLHPRQHPETLVNGLVIFRKYLFDALSHFDLKERILDDKVQLPGYTKIKRSHRWLEDATLLSIVVPMIELCKNPIRFDHYNILRYRTPTNEQIAFIKTFLQSKTPKEEGKWETGRKTFLPNLTRIELDITYECNLKCIHCNRSCTQAPTQTHMSLEQIHQFVQESIEMHKNWEIINVLGGEPTMHPDFNEIIQFLLNEYLIPHSPSTTLQITSNGYGEKVLYKLKALPQHPNVVVNTNSFKTGKEIPYFTPFNLAPIDLQGIQETEYHKGCWVTAYCGIGLNHLGYFACGVAGGIERILKTGQGIKTMAELNIQILQKQLQDYCRLCGNFSDYAINRGDFMERAEKDTPPKIAMSETWKKLYKNYNH